MTDRSDKYPALYSAGDGKIVRVVYAISDGSLWFTRYYFLIPTALDIEPFDDAVGGAQDD